MPSTRPRISFDDNGICNACQWAEQKHNVIDWDLRWKELEKWCDKFRTKDGDFDVVIPVSGGKDSCYVSWKMKHELGMHPLLVHIVPPLAHDVGNENLERLIAGGFDCIKIDPNPEIARKIARTEMDEYGDPLLSWMIPVRTGVFKTAINYGVKLIMWGEDGEVEYGGLTDSQYTPFHDRNYELEILLSGRNPERYLNRFASKELYYWLFPSQEEYDNAEIANMHFNYFDPWDQYGNYMLAKEKFGMQEKKGRNLGTFTNFAQTDTSMFELHTYFMYLKFGFGRCTSDACIDVRRGAMDRSQAVNLIAKFDNCYPEPYVAEYLDYMQISLEEFEAAIDRHANKKLFEKKVGFWTPKFEVK
jgi:N-acetyl sugar amidotransferase